MNASFEKTDRLIAYLKKESIKEYKRRCAAERKAHAREYYDTPKTFSKQNHNGKNIYIYE